MSDIAIKVENLGKRYRIGAEEAQHETLFGAATSWLKSPLQNFRNLRKLSTFGEDDDSEDIIWALKDVSFDVERGQVLGVIGRNGAGKSTLLKILSRITEPTSGRVEIRGRVSSLLEVGTGFHSELTGRENVYLNGTVLGMSRAEVDRNFDEIVEFSGIAKFIDTPVKRYSSGMKVRLAFAVAAHLEPEILLIDEVLAVGDLGFQKKCLGKMEDVAGRGRTVLFVSHQMPMVLSLCERCLLLDGGELSLDTTPGEAVTTYQERVQEVVEAGFPEMAERPGTGEFRFTHLRTYSPAENGSDALPRPGQPMCLEMGYVVTNESSLRNVDVSIKLLTPHGQPLLTFSTEFTGTPYRQLSGEGTLRCEVPNLPLTPGNYRVDLWAGVAGRTADDLDEASVLEVAEGDVFGTGNLPKYEKQGPLIADHKWVEK